MVDDQFNTMIMVISVNTFVRIHKELTEHIHTDKCRLLCSPVIMMEDNIRFHICADLLCPFQFPLCNIFDQFMHGFRLFVEIDHSILDLTEIMAHLKNSRCDHCSNHGFIPVNSGNCLLAFFPVLCRVVDVRCLYIFFPLCDFRTYQMLRIMERKCSRCSCRPGIIISPSAFYCRCTRSFRHHRILRLIRSIQNKCQSLILFYKTIWISSTDHFQHILSFC